MRIDIQKFEPKIITQGTIPKPIHNRTCDNSFIDEQARLVEDEANGIAKSGIGYCFNNKQLEAIKERLKNKLSAKEFASLSCKNDEGCFVITIKKSRKKYTKKQELLFT